MQKNFKLDSVPELPNVKILRLTIEDFEIDSLVSIANACPRLETFTVEVLMLCPIIGLIIPVLNMIWHLQIYRANFCIINGLRKKIHKIYMTLKFRGGNYVGFGLARFDSKKG